MSEASDASGSLFDTILFAADRDAAPGARPLVSFRPDDEAAFLAEVERRGRTRLRLLRHGVDHGRVVELDPAGLLPPLPHRRKLEAIWTARWMAAQPVLVPRLVELAGLAGAIEDALRKRPALLEPPEEHAPEVRAVFCCERLAALLQRFCGRPVRPQEPTPCWHAPDGGAEFSHAAEGDARGDFMARRLGTACVQLSGRTLWLALSIEDLAARVAEFLEILADDGLAGVRARLFPERSAWSDARALAADRRRLVHELGLPHCGRLSALVNRSPEFTALLADCGHALLLRPGDVLLLPNHGLERTAMHAVFCADTRPTYGLCMALRAAT
jgi:hypothetical protein